MESNERFPETAPGPVPDSLRLDRTVLTVTTLREADALDRQYWRSRTPEERMAPLEIMRQVAYGDAATARLQRILTGPFDLHG